MMKINRMLFALLLPVPALSVPAATAFAQSSRDPGQEEADRKRVVDFYNQFFNEHRIVEAATILTDDYKQHNPAVPDGKEPFIAYFMDFFKENPQSKARIVRSAADGDLVWLHVHSTDGPDDRGKAIVDIYRLQDGKIVEHWDVIQNVPETAANNNSMF